MYSRLCVKAIRPFVVGRVGDGRVCKILSNVDSLIQKCVQMFPCMLVSLEPICVSKKSVIGSVNFGFPSSVLRLGGALALLVKLPVPLKLSGSSTFGVLCSCFTCRAGTLFPERNFDLKDGPKKLHRPQNISSQRSSSRFYVTVKAFPFRCFSFMFPPN